MFNFNDTKPVIALVYYICGGTPTLTGHHVEVTNMGGGIDAADTSPTSLIVLL
jgi:uncharacterized protein (DUF433 family)